MVFGCACVPRTDGPYYHGVGERDASGCPSEDSCGEAIGAPFYRRF